MAETLDPLAGQDTRDTSEVLSGYQERITGLLAELSSFREAHGSLEEKRRHAQEIYDSAILGCQFLEKQLGGLIHNLGLVRNNLHSLLSELESDKGKL